MYDFGVLPWSVKQCQHGLLKTGFFDECGFRWVGC